MKYYFANQDSEMCYPKEHFIEEMKDNGITEIQVYPGKRMIGSGFYYCKELEVTGESGDGECGKWCDSYEPRNGKNGRCKFSNNCYEASEVSVKLTIK